MRVERSSSPGGSVEHVQLSERPLELLAVLRCSGHLLQRIDSGGHDSSNHRVERLRNLVVHPHPVAPGVDQPAAPKVGKMAGHRRLGQCQRVMDVTDADFVVSQQPQNPQSRLVSQCFEDVFQLIDCGSRFHG